MATFRMSSRVGTTEGSRRRLRRPPVACFTQGLRSAHDRLTATDDDAAHDAPHSPPSHGRRRGPRARDSCCGLSAPSDLTSDQGIVQSIDATQIELRALDGTVASFAVSAATRVRVNGLPGRLTDIRPGYVATVTHNGDTAGVSIRAFGKPAAVTSRGIVTVADAHVDHARQRCRPDHDPARPGTAFKFRGGPASAGRPAPARSSS